MGGSIVEGAKRYFLNLMDQIIQPKASGSNEEIGRAER